MRGLPPFVRNGPNTVSGSTVSNTEITEFFCPHRVPGRELSEFLSAYYFVCKSELTEFLAELTKFAAELSEFSLPKQYSQNSIPPVSYQRLLSENPGAHKNKIGTPLPPKNPKYPPPPQKNEEVYGHGGFPAERKQKFQAPRKVAHPFPAPELQTKIL